MARMGGRSRSRKEVEFYRKVLLQWPNGTIRVAWRDPPVTFDELDGDDLLDTNDLQWYFGCSARTIYRWIDELGLEPYDQIGQKLYFEKRTVVRWEKAHRPKRGRPFSR